MERITVLVEPEFKEKIKKKADKLGISVSVYLRLLMTEDLKRRR